MLYHIEFLGESGWEAFGSGEGSGEDRVALALSDMTSLAGGTLPEGEYRCIPALSESPRWESIWLGADGRVVDAAAVASAPHRSG